MSRCAERHALRRLFPVRFDAVIGIHQSLDVDRIFGLGGLPARGSTCVPIWKSFQLTIDVVAQPVFTRACALRITRRGPGPASRWVIGRAGATRCPRLMAAAMTSLRTIFQSRSAPSMPISKAFVRFRVRALALRTGSHENPPDESPLRASLLSAEQTDARAAALARSHQVSLRPAADLLLDRLLDNRRVS